MTMKRRQFLKAGALATGAAGGLVRPALAQSVTPSQPVVKWRLTSSFPRSLDIIFSASQMFAKYVAEATDNNFLIVPSPAGEIAPGLQALETVTSGAVECAHTPTSFYTAKDPALVFGTGIPFGLNARHQQAWWDQGGGADLVNESLKKFNVLGLPMGSTGARMGGWFRREINGVEDLAGLKFRVDGMGAQVLTRLGVVPQQLNRKDLLVALENGSIDGAEFIGPYDDEKLGIVRFAKNYYYPGWRDGGGMLHLVVNLEAWSKLPKSYQAIVMQACATANAWMLSRYDAVNAPALKRLTAAGANIKPFPAPVLEALLKAANEHYGELAGQSPQFKKALDSVTAFRAEQLAWWQISEYALDGMAIALKGKG